MARLYVVMLAASVLWIFGTLPWLVINRFLCSSASDLCPNLPQFEQQALSILVIDLLLLAVSAYAASQLRRIQRSR